MSKKLVAGNWKMNKTPNEAIEFVKLLKDKLGNSESDVVCCVPFVELLPVCDILKDSNIEVGAQNMYFEDKGAYTGEVSADMLTEIGVKYVIIGHSERRMYFAETDDTVNLKIKKAIEKGLTPIVCVGESLAQRDGGVENEVVRIQVKAALKDISAKDASKIVIAYEPIWAIGTGRTASDQQAEDMCKGIHEVVAELYDSSVGSAVKVLYGGSVNAGNAKGLFSMPNIDGALVGGASLKEEFEEIANYSK